MKECRFLGLCLIQYRKQVNQPYLLVRYPVTVEFCLLTNPIKDDKEFSTTSFFSVPAIFNECHKYPKTWSDMLHYYETI